MSPPHNGWNEWSRHVLAELERLNECGSALDGKITQVRIDIAQLKVKAGVWGLIGASIPVVVGLALVLIKGLLGGGD